MPSCHSVHDLELAVQDLWAHLPQDIIRCLINSMPDRVVACIAAGEEAPRGLLVRSFAIGPFESQSSDEDGTNEIISHSPKVYTTPSQINLEVDNDDVQELLDSHNQELTVNELIEMHEQQQGIEGL
ncbi:transposable element Tcb2 transposase [Trichonephila clavipes]|nr:transposable element Tcb2 transposase [Trichonephila clavipes]